MQNTTDVLFIMTGVIDHDNYHGQCIKMLII